MRTIILTIVKLLRFCVPYGIVSAYDSIKISEKQNQEKKEAHIVHGNENMQHVEIANDTADSNVIVDFREQRDKQYIINCFDDLFLKTLESGEKVFDINGIIFPDVRIDVLCHSDLCVVFQDSLYFWAILNDNYDIKLVRMVDLYMKEGPYCLTDEKNDFSVTVQDGDIVIDAGAWIGDFSAYAAAKGASKAYAFEPVQMTYEYLCETAKLNGENVIIPVQKCLSDTESQIKMATYECSIASRVDSVKGNTVVDVTTIDKFVEENQIEKIDFIKADIEGHERNMLIGAKNTIQKYTPKLAICTYHLHDDQAVLKNIILDINPNYKIVQLRHKLFACIPRVKH